MVKRVSLHGHLLLKCVQRGVYTGCWDPLQLTHRCRFWSEGDDSYNQSSSLSGPDLISLSPQPASFPFCSFLSQTLVSFLKQTGLSGRCPLGYLGNSRASAQITACRTRASGHVVAHMGRGPERKGRPLYSCPTSLHPHAYGLCVSDVTDLRRGHRCQRPDQVAAWLSQKESLCVLQALGGIRDPLV